VESIHAERTLISSTARFHSLEKREIFFAPPSNEGAEKYDLLIFRSFGFLFLAFPRSVRRRSKEY
jgi:hypothetical protein